MQIIGGRPDRSHRSSPALVVLPGGRPGVASKMIYLWNHFPDPRM
jgi:hypothetical protein